MAYKNFSFSDLENKFGIRQTTATLFTKPITPVEPSNLLLEMLDIASRSAITTEKAVSEAIVYPILQTVKIRNQDLIELFSGENLDGDKSNGLNGECDFIIALAPLSKELKAPIISVTETKQGNIDKPKPLAQASAQLIGARLFNQHNNQIIEPLFGACTSGTEWLFLKLEGNLITVDTRRFSTVNLPELLGVLQTIIDAHKP
jgi:hypothetical protein